MRSAVLLGVLTGGACRGGDDAPRKVDRAAAAPSVVPASEPSGETLAATPSAGAVQPVMPCPPEMVRIPAGESWIGSVRGEGSFDEWPRYRSRFPAFCLDRTEVTWGAYKSCVTAGKCKPPGADRVTCTAASRTRDEHPVNCVDYEQASRFCAFREARLPREAEWEYAARGGDMRKYSWGDETPDDRACWKTHTACKVASFPPGAFGLYDMTGNVWEWTSDWHGDYPWPKLDGESKVYRGGSWSRRFEKWMDVRLRNRAAPGSKGSHLGFRCAKTIAGEPCPFGADDRGECLSGVLEVDCRPERTWNGIRCAPVGEAGCAEGRAIVPGHGCVRTVRPPEPSQPGPDLASVRRSRTPEFDRDCATFQEPRRIAYRFEGSTHDARNQVLRSAGCKNRDVGVGWNSACCP
jgi:formylglycine-generating enzyme required for sulfatase activity